MAIRSPSGDTWGLRHNHPKGKTFNSVAYAKQLQTSGCTWREVCPPVSVTVRETGLLGVAARESLPYTVSLCELGRSAT